MPSAEETQNPFHFRRIKHFLPLAEQEEATEVLEVEGIWQCLIHTGTSHPGEQKARSACAAIDDLAAAARHATELYCKKYIHSPYYPRVVLD